MQTAPAPSTACVQQHRTFLTNPPKTPLGFERTNKLIWIILFFKTLPPPTLLRSFRPDTVLEITELQVNLVIFSTPYDSAWERGLVHSTLCAGKRFLCPACSASELWGAERERRGLLASILILDLLWCKTWLWEGKGRQCIYCSQTLFGGSERPWACCLPLSTLPCSKDTTLTLHVDVPPPACGAGGHEGSTLRMENRDPGEEHSGAAHYPSLSWRIAFPHNESVQHVKRCSSTGILPGGFLSWELALDPRYKWSGFGV